MCNVSFSENTYLKYSFLFPVGKNPQYSLLCACETWFIVVLSSSITQCVSVSGTSYCYLVPSEATPLLSQRLVVTTLSQLSESSATRLHVDTCSACLSACVMTSSSMHIITSCII